MALQPLRKANLSFMPFVTSSLVMVSSAIAITVLSEGITTIAPGLNNNVAVAAQKSLGEQVFEKTSPAVVTIRTQGGWGSGTIIQANGLLLTNAHVVQGDRTVTVVFQDGKTASADVVALGQDCLDLALVQLRQSENLPTVPFGTADSVRPGQQVYAIGSPERPELSGSFINGIVSKVNPELGLIQTSLGLNPGNSGGPLLSEDGSLIGVNTSRLDQSQNISFSIPVSRVQSFLKEYRQGRTVRTQPTHTTPTIPLDGKKISGSLSSSDRISCADRSFYDLYQFEGKAGQSVRIHMQSSAFAPYLTLLDANGNKIAVDPNTPKDDYAVIYQQLPTTGLYKVVANSRLGKQLGNYALSVSPLVLWRKGELSSDKNTFKDGSLYDSYRFQGNAQQEVTISMYSSDFVPYLALMDEKGNVVDRAAGEAQSKSAAVKLKLPRAGTYTVIASTVKPGEMGRFSVLVR